MMFNPFECVVQNDVTGLLSYLESGSVNVLDAKGQSLLVYAVRLKNNEIFRILCEHYIDINLKDIYGNTAYHYAVIGNRLTYLKHLFNMNGDFLALNNRGQSPLYLAFLYGRDEMISLYYEYQIKLDLGVKDGNDETIFMALVRSRNLNILKKYYDFNYLEVPNYCGQRPLSIAVCQRDLEMACYLIEQKAFVNAKNFQKETALFSAVRNQDYPMIDFLLAKGAIPWCSNSEGLTIFDLDMTDDLRQYLEMKVESYHLNDYIKYYPLHYAIIVEDRKLLTKSMVLGNIERKDCYGKYPLDLAIAYGDKVLKRQISFHKRKAHSVLSQNKILY